MALEAGVDTLRPIELRLADLLPTWPQRLAAVTPPAADAITAAFYAGDVPGKITAQCVAVARYLFAEGGLAVPGNVRRATPRGDPSQPRPSAALCVEALKCLQGVLSQDTPRANPAISAAVKLPVAELAGELVRRYAAPPRGPVPGCIPAVVAEEALRLLLRLAERPEALLGLTGRRGPPPTWAALTSALPSAGWVEGSGGAAGEQLAPADETLLSLLLVLSESTQVPQAVRRLCRAVLLCAELADAVQAVRTAARSVASAGSGSDPPATQAAVDALAAARRFSAVCAAGGLFPPDMPEDCPAQEIPAGPDIPAVALAAEADTLHALMHPHAVEEFNPMWICSTAGGVAGALCKIASDCGSRAARSDALYNAAGAAAACLLRLLGNRSGTELVCAAGERATQLQGALRSPAGYARPEGIPDLASCASSADVVFLRGLKADTSNDIFSALAFLVPAHCLCHAVLCEAEAAANQPVLPCGSKDMTGTELPGWEAGRAMLCLVADGGRAGLWALAQLLCTERGMRAMAGLAVMSPCAFGTLEHVLRSVYGPRVILSQGQCATLTEGRLLDPQCDELLETRRVYTTGGLWQLKQLAVERLTKLRERHVALATRKGLPDGGPPDTEGLAAAVGKAAAAVGLLSELAASTPALCELLNHGTHRGWTTDARETIATDLIAQCALSLRIMTQVLFEADLRLSLRSTVSGCPELAARHGILLCHILRLLRRVVRKVVDDQKDVPDDEAVCWRNPFVLGGILRLYAGLTHTERVLPSATRADCLSLIADIVLAWWTPGAQRPPASDVRLLNTDVVRAFIGESPPLQVGLTELVREVLERAVAATGGILPDPAGFAELRLTPRPPASSVPAPELRPLAALPDDLDATAARAQWPLEHSGSRNDRRLTGTREERRRLKLQPQGGPDAPRPPQSRRPAAASDRLVQNLAHLVMHTVSLGMRLLATSAPDTKGADGPGVLSSPALAQHFVGMLNATRGKQGECEMLHKLLTREIESHSKVGEQVLALAAGSVDVHTVADTAKEQAAKIARGLTEAELAPAVDAKTGKRGAEREADRAKRRR
eukprot:TRINITY_DN55076_c0_g1_i1.p1 TRINITY_DN55076_c0_g1~~TRINITY_DN55076_c0_g1_i1.p1  ORF type:complete len:1095 (+),score=322.86 TRINITY_DN55076_c0_g1_i1:86-3286(+)